MMTRTALTVLLTLSMITILANVALADEDTLAISGVPVELVSADALPAEWDDYTRDQRVVVVLDGGWAFPREDIVESYRDGSPMVVRFHTYRLPLEFRLLIDPAILDQETLVGIIEPSWLDDGTEATLNGRSTHEPNLAGIIDPTWLNPDIADTLHSRLLDERAVAITRTGFYAEGITFVDVRLTTGVPVGIINPDSMHPGGWAGSQAWVSWEDCRACWLGANPTPHP